MNANTNVVIREGTIAECIEISNKIPEFNTGNYGEETYLQRLSNTKHLILVAIKNNELAGFKVGYDRDQDGSFYTWLGGVLPKFRQDKIATILAEKQENWAKEQGFKSITLKTRNRFKAMLIFALKNNFLIENVEPKEQIDDNRILLRKILK
ncbi:GCN5-related N-acetyltransferase [Emticicia oligotrophica DSM 17448]|uniref:GCN5-related N-acetyltransferase n=1 Tax=Emticicia oligotrophica (strain DSM 17448 / CIP 109782 / MTCC 6937 / GPTSA100-15) TaxID=929562 RepID=A0ABM5N159_EMTOG|nr:GNAT family N-acetyltransferase [Emticicia oligotrophica]AFK03173.1 GCN5-related N-acetyltransferase [Emticicia oligotrophica DSM 17448]